MSEWANCSSPSSDSPDSDRPQRIQIMFGGSGAGVDGEREKFVRFCESERPHPTNEIILTLDRLRQDGLPALISPDVLA